LDRDKKFKVALVSLDGPPLEDRTRSQLTENRIELIERECASPDEVVSVAHDAEVVWVSSGSRVVTPEILPRLTRCGAILRSGSGADNVPIEDATRMGIVVANTPEGHMHAVAEHAIGLLFAVIRRIAVQDRAVRQGVWDREHAWPGYHIVGQTLGLIGFGRIGQLVAKKLSGMEMKLIASDPGIDEATMADFGVESIGLDELLERSDFISIHTPLTEKTHHLISEPQLQLCKKEAVLINTARGSVIDEPSLVRALSEGWIGGAGLDVLEQEPTSPNNPLFAQDNVVITPHIAGYSDECWQIIREHSADTLVRFSKGQWPKWCVNPLVKSKWNLGEAG
jgi:D-3-phosphoglycerate dehydrogenase